MEEESKPTPQQARGDGPDWKLCGVLMSVALLASLAVLPYLIEVLAATGEQVVVWEFAVSTVAEHMFLAGLAVCIGLMLGPRVDLGTPLLNDGLSRKTGWVKRARSSVFAAVTGGVGVAVALSLADPWLEGLMPAWPESARKAEQAAESMAAWKPLLASFAAGVTEEIVFRYGLMTLLVWLGVKVARRDAPMASLLWMANLLAALLFSLAHLMNVVELEIAITPGMVLYVVIWNGIASIVFGWLYWRRGLESAILAHALADVVVKVIAPLLSAG